MRCLESWVQALCSGWAASGKSQHLSEPQLLHLGPGDRQRPLPRIVVMVQGDPHGRWAMLSAIGKPGQVVPNPNQGRWGSGGLSGTGGAWLSAFSGQASV